MITQKEIDNLRPGDKLIFFRNGDVLSAVKGNVFTFSNWLKDGDEHNTEKIWWQCKEINDLGNHEHNFSIYDTELFDTNEHKDHNIMTSEKVKHHEREFSEKHGL